MTSYIEFVTRQIRAASRGQRTFDYRRYIHYRFFEAISISFIDWRPIIMDHYNLKIIIEIKIYQNIY